MVIYARHGYVHNRTAACLRGHAAVLLSSQATLVTQGVGGFYSLLTVGHGIHTASLSDHALMRRSGFNSPTRPRSSFSPFSAARLFQQSPDGRDEPVCIGLDDVGVGPGAQPRLAVLLVRPAGEEDDGRYLVRPADLLAEGE